MRPQARPQRHQQQQNNGYHNQHQHNGYQPPVNPHPMMMPNMPMHPQFFFNNLNMPQQQQFQQFGLPNHINQLLPNLLGNLMGGYSLPPLVHPTVFQPPLDPSSFTSQPPFNSLPYPPGFSEPRPQSVGNVNNNVTSNSKGNDFRNKFTKQQKFKGTGQGSQLHQADHVKKKFGFSKDHLSKGNNKKISTGFDGSDADNIAKEKKRSSALW